MALKYFGYGNISKNNGILVVEPETHRLPGRTRRSLYHPVHKNDQKILILLKYIFSFIRLRVFFNYLNR